jgi:hypothetical protein
MGERGAEEDGSGGSSLSLMCLEDGADLDAGGSAESADDGEPAVVAHSDAGEDEEEEYIDYLVSKESSFCCSPSSSPVSSDAGAETRPSSTASSSDQWFRCARHATVAWILEVIARPTSQHDGASSVFNRLPFRSLTARSHRICRRGLTSASPTARRTWPSPTWTASASAGAWTCVIRTSHPNHGRFH